MSAKHEKIAVMKVPEGYYKPLVGEIPPNRMKPLKTPQDYMTAEAAYKLVSRLTLAGVTNVSAGYDPGEAEDDVAVWGNYGTPSTQLVRAARETLGAMDKGTPKELNDRMDGAVSQKVEIGGKFVLEAPAKMDEDAWTKLFGPATATATIEQEAEK